MMIPTGVSHYRLLQAHVPVSLLQADAALIEAARVDGRSPLLSDDFCRVDLEIRDGMIVAIAPAGQLDRSDAPQQFTNGRGAVEPDSSVVTVDLRGKQVWPCFIDMHTHLDKGHVWERSPNPSSTFDQALDVIRNDAATYWQADDLYPRMNFGLKCSYAHGTRAVRTHIDAYDDQAQISLDVFRQLQHEWRDRLTLQAVCLVTLDYFLTSAGEALADQMATVDGGILGGVSFPHDDLDHQLDRVFALAKERNLSLDFHSDESGDPHDKTLRHIAEAALRHKFDRSIVCGHCCSLAVQSPEEVQATLEAVKAANIGIVSLPLCNLYLQDRNQMASRRFQQGDVDLTPERSRLHTGKTPRWRGMTLLHELKHAGIPVAIANDNCRDPFHGFGDHDAFEVYNLSTRIAHLDSPYGTWPRSITTTPADLMELPCQGRIGVGLAADLVIFKARTFSELLSRPQSDRTVIRDGQAIDTTLPDYEELDDLMLKPLNSAPPTQFVSS